MTGATVPLVGWTLIHFLWQGAAIAASAALVLWLLRDASAQSRYATACGALMLMLLAPIATARSLAALPSRATTPTVQRAEIQVVIVRRDGAPWPMAPRSASPPAARPVDPALRLLVVGWLGGVLLLGMRLTGGLWRAWAMQRTARAGTPSPWQDSARLVAARLGMTCPVMVVDSDVVDTPAMLGWLSPLVVLPAAALAGLSPAQVEAILAHELAHVRRHDALVNLLQSVAETLLFYHPGVWWVSRRIRAEREHCCDDAAVAVSGDRVAYAAALAELEAFRSAQGTFALASTDGSLLGRVRRVLAPGHGEPRAAHRLAAAAIVTLVLLGGGALVQQLGATAGRSARIEEPPRIERVRLLQRRSSATGNTVTVMTAELVANREIHRELAVARILAVQEPIDVPRWITEGIGARGLPALPPLPSPQPLPVLDQLEPLERN